jgi:hypothetical protein
VVSADVRDARESFSFYYLFCFSLLVCVLLFRSHLSYSVGVLDKGRQGIYPGSVNVGGDGKLGCRGRRYCTSHTRNFLEV